VRLQSKNPVNVAGTVIGGPNPLICIPLVAADKKELLDQAASIKSLSPDLVEWRADGYKGIGEIPDCLAALDALRSVIGNIPLIFTCRIEAEGGMQPLSQAIRRCISEAAIQSKAIDIVDIELINDDEFIDAIRSAAGSHGVKLILSYHDFTKTPKEDFILDKLKQAQRLGADIAKVAVMPKGYQDVLTLLGATLKARSQALDIPLITISMAQEGLVSRMAGGLFGSDITFALGQASSAPGQIPIGELRQAMGLLYSY
jgi:3-dehydroquinate dehydratase-1